MSIDPYKTLGVPKNASSEEIKVAFKASALKYHPDKNRGNKEAEEKFKEVNLANHILSNPQRRAEYDEYGHAGAPPQFGFSPHDLFEELGRFFKDDQQKSQDLIHTVRVSLKDLYNGVKKTIKYLRKRICVSCEGRGAKLNATSQKCKTCAGKGVYIVRSLSFFGTIQQTQPCHDCQGAGENYSSQDKCPICNGKKNIQETKILQVEIPAGTENGHVITFTGEADQQKNLRMGDVHIQIQEVESEGPWYRSGKDLILEKEISLVESLTGFDIGVTHLNGRELCVTCQNITKPNEVKMVEKEGMPTKENQKGDLYIKFDVKFPEKLTSDQAKLLRNILGEPKKFSGNATVVAKEVDLSKKKPKHNSEESWFSFKN